MREILFRGKTDNGEWICGHYYTQGFHLDTIEEDWYHFIKPIGSKSWGEVRVIPQTVGQYTGLTDKNGTKIFEGDIVLFSWGDDRRRQPFYIEFVDGEFRATPKESTENIWSIRIASYACDFEVIGNIHDNLELLEESEKTLKAREVEGK